MKAGEECVNLGDNPSFIAEVYVMIGVRDHDDARTWYSVLEVIGPGGAACFIVCDQSSLPSCPVIRQTVPVVGTGVDGKSGNRDIRIFCIPKFIAALIGERGGNGGIFATLPRSLCCSVFATTMFR